MSDREPETAQGRRIRRIIIGTVAFAIIATTLAVAVPLTVTSTSDFFSRYHLLERRYVNLEDSAHEGIGCRSCHETEPLANGLALVGDFYTSIFSAGKQPRYFTFGPPTREACLSCHEDDWASAAGRVDRIPHPAHARVASEERECVQCHKWTAHFEPYMEKHKAMPFSGVCVAYGCHVGTKTTEECFDCHHVLHEAGEQWRTAHPAVVKARGENTCLESCHQVAQCQTCHTTGVRPEFTGLPIEIGMKAIEELHVKPEWTAEFHGAEALKNKDNCMRCHESVDECDECHLQRPAFHGSTETWIGRHATSTKDLADPACLACHKSTFCQECHDQFKEMG